MARSIIDTPARSLRRALREERGQALILVTISMAVVLGVAALAIDAASWYQKHHEAQVAADSASLAAANCLANAGSGKTCTSTTDTADAQKVATTFALDNGVTIPTSAVTVNISSKTVTVLDSADAGSLFAGIVGIQSSSQGARATASFRSPTTSVQTNTNVETTTTALPGSPLVLFGMDSSCSTDSVTQQGGSMTINGGIISNGSVFLDPGGSTYESINYGTGSGCGATLEGGGGNFTDGQPTAASSNLTSWPVPYNTAADPLPACTDTYKGSGTWQIGNQSSTTPQVFCYPNGAIQLTGWESYEDDTYICGSFSIQGGGIGLKAANYPTNKLLIYATGTGTPVSLTNGSGVVVGDVETPNGNITLDSGSNSFTGLLEGQEVNFSGGSDTITGDGPTESAGTTTTTKTTTTTQTTTLPGGDSLTG